MNVIYNFINMYIGEITINIHDNVCYGSDSKHGKNPRNNFTAFVWNSYDPKIAELQQRIDQSEREKQDLIDKLSEINREDINHQSENL
jgi:hypothetical protein